MHPGGFPAFLRGKMMAISQIWGDSLVEKLRLKMSLAIGPRALSSGPGAPLARIWRMASPSSSYRKAAQQLSHAGGNFNVDFSCCMRFLSNLLNRRRLTAAYSFMKVCTREPA